MTTKPISNIVGVVAIMMIIGLVFSITSFAIENRNRNSWIMTHDSWAFVDEILLGPLDGSSNSSRNMPMSLDDLQVLLSETEDNELQGLTAQEIAAELQKDLKTEEKEQGYFETFFDSVVKISDYLTVFGKIVALAIASPFTFYASVGLTGTVLQRTVVILALLPFVLLIGTFIVYFFIGRNRS